MDNSTDSTLVDKKSTAFDKGTKMVKRIKTASIAAACILATSASFAYSVETDQSEEMVRILSQGDLDKVHQLFSRNIDINLDIDGDGTPLIIAVQNGNKALVQYLLEQGADVNRESIQDGNPLIVAALKNNLDLVKYLYSQGAELDTIVEHDETALISASRAGHFQIVKYLVEVGADVNLAVNVETVRGRELRSPLNGAKTKEIYDYLLAQGAVNN